MNPTVASLILSLESCISVLAGWVLLDQKLSIKELLGCVIMFAAIILAQLPEKEKIINKNRQPVWYFTFRLPVCMFLSLLFLPS